jgi:hypothetical protein
MPATSVRLFFANGAYDFALPGAAIEEIERERNIGLGAIYARTLAGSYPDAEDKGPAGMVGSHYPESAQFFYQDLLHVIHKALLHGGGGEALGNKITMTPSIADRLMRDYIINTGDRRMAMMQIWKLGRSILYVLAEGYTPPKKRSRWKARRPNRATRLGRMAHQLPDDGHPAVGGQAADVVGISGLPLELERPARHRQG